MKQGIQKLETHVFCDSCGFDFVAIKPFEEYLGFKCEKCGAIMVTQKDLDSHKLIGESVDAINNAIGGEDISEECVSVKFSVSTNGTIKVKGK
jgi:predicted RNA-binding Zn-ribbon protein involved in translation (DUF1610 family)